MSRNYSQSQSKYRISDAFVPMESNVEQVKDVAPNLVRGVAVSWVAQILQILSGFIVPRMIDHSLGSETLGVWDLGWSLVSYFTLLEAGIGSSINRHVALYRAGSEMERVNGIISSVAMLQRAIGLLVLIVTAVLAWNLRFGLQNAGPTLLSQAKWLVLLLGSSVALSFSGAVYTGVLTGCHRWAVHHSVYAATNILSFVGMLAVLSCGMGIVALAAVHMVTELLGRIVRAIIAYRVCPGLRIRLHNADLKTLRSMLSFGGKMFVGRMSLVLMIQTTSVLIAAYLGPAALALFTRPRSLVRQAAVFPQKYAFMLIPSVAALAGAGKTGEVRSFVRESSRNGLWISLPLITFLAIAGAPLIELWMGPRYAVHGLILVMTLTFAAEIAHMPLNNLLMGLNLHGRPGLVSMVAALVAIALVWVALALSLGLTAVALGMCLPWFLAHGIYLPIYACRRLELPLRTFFKDVWLRPLISMIPFGLALWMGQHFFAGRPLASLMAGCVSGGCVLATCYWIWAIPRPWKHRILKSVGFRPESRVFAGGTAVESECCGTPKGSDANI